MLSEIRRRAGLTTPELAALLGVHPSTAYAWESGRRKLRTRQLSAILAVLGAAAGEDELLAKKLRLLHWRGILSDAELSRLVAALEATA